MSVKYLTKPPMWSLLFCISSTSILSRSMALRTADQRRSSSAVEIGVFRRSDMRDSPWRLSGGRDDDVVHRFVIAGEEAAHIVLDRRQRALLVEIEEAAEMRIDV